MSSSARTFPPPKGVIFDMDGLLLDTENAGLEAWMLAAQTLGYQLPEELCHGMIGLNIAASNALMRQHLGEEFPVEQLREIRRPIYHTLIEKGAGLKKPGAHEILDFVDRKGLRRVLATSTSRTQAEQKLLLSGLRFSYSVCGDEVTNSKPDPEIYQKAASLLNLMASECIVLEDSNAGASGALKAGSRVIAVPDLLPILPEHSVHAIVPDLFSAMEMIEAWLRESS